MDAAGLSRRSSLQDKALEAELQAEGAEASVQLLELLVDHRIKVG